MKPTLTLLFCVIALCAWGQEGKYDSVHTKAKIIAQYVSQPNDSTRKSIFTLYDDNVFKEEYYFNFPWANIKSEEECWTGKYKFKDDKLILNYKHSYIYKDNKLIRKKLKHKSISEYVVEKDGNISMTRFKTKIIFIKQK